MMQENVPIVATRNKHVKIVSSYINNQIGGMIYKYINIVMELVWLGV